MLGFMAARTSRHAYKEIHLQQLRSFCETARLGSMAAAAERLDLSQPTVWEQVHALEHLLGVTLIQRHARGCRLTEAGRCVAALAAPLVQGAASFKQAVHEALGQKAVQLTIATTQRILVEDLPQSILDFERRYPRAQLRLLELRVEQVPAAVEGGEADLGLTTEEEIDRLSPWLVFEPAYALDVYLVTPKDHPLARRARVRPRDLLHYPLVNSPQSIPNAILAGTLEKLGIFQTPPRRVEAFYTAVIRRYVELGFGIGLIVGLPDHSASSALCERSMSRYFGRIPINFVWRKGDQQRDAALAFTQTIRSFLNRRRRRKTGST
jgi:DNA-binding transcriptional LysR family regulator